MWPITWLDMREINNKIQAASHSGASLEVIQEGNAYLVQKKISSSIDKNYNSILKQRNFQPLVTPSYHILAIPVLDINKTESELCVSMPFIEGLGGEQVAYRGSKTVAKNLKMALDFYLINSFSQSDDGSYPREAIQQKILSIKEQIVGRSSIYPGIDAHIEALSNYCDKDLQLPIGDCHGDLTLSNLKVTEQNQLTLFDFLSCDINSPLQDAAKLIQDFEFGWSFRKEKESIRVKGDIFCDHAMPSFIKTLNRLFNYEMRVIEALTILRIAPYIQDNDLITVTWFNQTIAKTMQKITG